MPYTVPMTKGPSGGIFDDLFGDNGSTLKTAAEEQNRILKPTKYTFSVVDGTTSYRPYDRLIALNKGERTGGKLDQMLLEADKLRQAGFTDVYREFNLTADYERKQKWGVAFLTGLGKAMQPLAAPQQVFFGNLAGLTDLMQGDVKGGMEKWKRANLAAIGFATYGAISGMNRDGAIYGKEITNDWGIKGTAGSITGGLMDFFADPLLLAGVVGKAGSLARLGKLGSALKPAELLADGTRASKPIADIFQRVTSMTDVVNNVSTGAIKNPAAFRRAAGEILRNPLQTSRSIPGLFSDDARYAGSAWSTIRENLDAAGAVESALSVANGLIRVPYSQAPIKQLWQTVPMSARISMGQAVGSAIEGARFIPTRLGEATASGMTVAESIVSRWGTIAGIPEVNIAKLKETGRTYGAGISRVLQDSFRQRQIEAANMALRATDLTARYGKITGQMDEMTKRGFDHFTSKVLDAKDPAVLMQAWRDFETFTDAHGVTQQAADFVRRTTDYDVYGALVRARLGMESQSGLHSYQAGEELLNMIVRGEMDKAQDMVNQWQRYMVNPAFDNVMVQGYREIKDGTGKVVGERPIYNPVIGRNSPATPLGKKVGSVLFGDSNLQLSNQFNKLTPTEQAAYITGQAMRGGVRTPQGITGLIDEARSANKVPKLPSEQYDPIFNTDAPPATATDWNKAITELPQSLQVPAIKSATMFGDNLGQLSSAKLPDELKSTQDFMDEIIPVLDEAVDPKLAGAAADGAEETPKIGSKFPQRMGKYKALQASDEASIRRVQSVLYMDEVRVREAMADGADVTADSVGPLSPFRATYVEDGVRYVRPETPTIIRGDDGGIYVKTGDDTLKVVADSDGKIYAYGADVNVSSKRKRATFVDESPNNRPLDPSLEPNIGSSKSYVAFGALRNDPAAIMQGDAVGAFTDDIAKAQEIEQWIGKKGNEEFGAAAEARRQWEGTANSIFDSNLISEIKPVRFSPDKVEVYDRAMKGMTTPGNNPDKFLKPDGTPDTDLIAKLKEQFPDWELFKPLTKDSEYDDLLMFHGGTPPADNLFAGNPRDYAKANGLLGKGIYLTDWDGMAGNYARGATTGEVGAVYAVRLGKGQRLLDMDAAPRDPQYLVRRSFKYLMEKEGLPKAEVDLLKDEMDMTLKWIKEQTDAGTPPSGFDILDTVRFGAGHGYSPTPRLTLDDRANAWHDALIDRGYTGMRHVGGKRLGSDEDLHNVVVLVGNGRESAPKTVLNRKQLAVYDANTGELVRRSDPLGETMGNPKSGMAVKSSDTLKSKFAGEGLQVKLATLSGKRVKMDRLTPEEARTAMLEINLSSAHIQVNGVDYMAKDVTRLLAEARGKGMEKAIIETRVNDTVYADPNHKMLPDQSEIDDLFARIPGITAREIDRSAPTNVGTMTVRYELDLTNGLFADPNAVFGPHGYRKMFGTEADITPGFSSTKADYGQQVTTAENPYAPAWADRNPNAWNPDERMTPKLHLRRMFMASENGELVIRSIDQSRGAAVAFDEGRLQKTLLKVLVENNKNDVTAVEFAEDFMRAWADPNVAPIDYIADFFERHSLSTESRKKMMKDINNDIWKMGIDWRPPGEELAKQMHEYLAGRAGISAASSGPLQNATSRGAEKSRADLAPHWQEALMQIDDIGQAIAKNAEINEKVLTRRGMVQDMYNFLSQEGGIISKDEWTKKLTTRSGWFTITEGVHSQLKGLKAVGAESGADLPFKVGDMIPAAYGHALAAMVTTAKPGVASALLQLANAKWKQLKIANPATISRDVGSNFAFAASAGINPIRMAKGLEQMNRLYQNAKKVGGGQVDLIDDLAHITLSNGEKVTMREMMEAGDFLHSGFLLNEVNEPASQLMKELANPNGENVVQRTAAAYQRWAERMQEIRGEGGAPAAGLKVASAAAQVAGAPGSAVKWLGDIKGQMDMKFKGAVYLLKREEGLSPAKAAKFADELFFNYENVPYTVDYLRRTGISPFAAFQFLSAGRLIKTMYENPYAIHRLYRIPGSVRQGVGPDEYDNEARNRPQYMRNSIWLPMVYDGKIVRDEQGRSRWFNLGAYLPEQATSDMLMSGPGGMLSQVVSPTIEMLTSVITGIGYRGMSLYPGGGNIDSAVTGPTPIRDRTAAEVMRALYRHGMSPWAPGQPMMERLADSIQYTEDQYIIHPGARKFMAMVEDYLRDGPAVNAVQAATKTPEWEQRPTGPTKQAPLGLPTNILSALAGVTVTPIQPDAGMPGAARNNIYSLKAKQDALRSQLRRDLMSARPEDVPAIQAYYDKEFAKLGLEWDINNLSDQQKTAPQTPSLDFNY